MTHKDRIDALRATTKVITSINQCSDLTEIESLALFREIGILQMQLAALVGTIISDRLRREL